MKVTVKTVSDRITILENQKTISLNEEFQLAVYRWALELKKGVEAAEAKLAELAKQKPVGTVSIAMDWNTHCNVATVNMRHDLVVSEMKDGDELFTRPAPAAVPVLYRWWFKDKPDQINIIQPDLVDTLVRKDGLVIEGLVPVSREDGLDAKRRAFIDSLADNTSTQYDSLRKAEE